MAANKKPGDPLIGIFEGGLHSGERGMAQKAAADVQTSNFRSSPSVTHPACLEEGRALTTAPGMPNSVSGRRRLQSDICS